MKSLLVKGAIETVIAVYGTLRDGEGNDHYLKRDGVEFLGNAETVPEFTMRNMSGFPIVVTEGKTPIKIEVYKITNQQTLHDIFRLEHYTGRRNHPDNWYNTTDIDTPFGKAEMFVMSPERYPSLRVIPSGDWKNR